jgi:hypothetical protein
VNVRNIRRLVEGQVNALEFALMARPAGVEHFIVRAFVKPDYFTRAKWR